MDFKALVKTDKGEKIVLIEVQKAKFLSIFDQTEKRENAHLLEIKEDEYPVHYQKLLRRLQKAALESKLRKDMNIEDEIIEDLENLERKNEE